MKKKSLKSTRLADLGQEDIFNVIQSLRHALSIDRTCCVRIPDEEWERFEKRKKSYISFCTPVLWSVTLRNFFVMKARASSQLLSPLWWGREWLSNDPQRKKQEKRTFVVAKAHFETLPCLYFLFEYIFTWEGKMEGTLMVSAPDLFRRRMTGTESKKGELQSSWKSLIDVCILGNGWEKSKEWFFFVYEFVSFSSCSSYSEREAT